MTTYQFYDITKAVTDIDRRKCQREVPMQVLALGLCRTGTDSLRQALRRLGYNDTYHGYSAVLENPRDCEMWWAALRAKYEGDGQPFTRLEFDQLLGHCQAVCDFPAACFASELVQAYPEAKVILTTRDVVEWHRSVKRKFEPLLLHPLFPVLDFVDNIFQMRTRWARPTWRAIWRHFFRGDFDAYGRNAFEEHYDLVRKIVPAENLLLYDIRDGWAPLCQFLGKPIPAETFPHGNDSETFHRRFRDAILYSLKEVGEKVVRYAMCFMWLYWGIRQAGLLFFGLSSKA